MRCGHVTAAPLARCPVLRRHVRPGEAVRGRRHCAACARLAAPTFSGYRAAGTVRHVHWGAALPLADAAALPLWSDHDNSFAGRWDGTEEYPADGGPRFGTPAWWPVGPEKRTIWKSCRKGRRSCARPPTG